MVQHLWEDAEKSAKDEVDRMIAKATWDAVDILEKANKLKEAATIKPSTSSTPGPDVYVMRRYVGTTEAKYHKTVACQPYAVHPWTICSRAYAEENGCIPCRHRTCYGHY